MKYQELDFIVRAIKNLPLEVILTLGEYLLSLEIEFYLVIAWVIYFGNWVRSGHKEMFFLLFDQNYYLQKILKSIFYSFFTFFMI